jgi:hypothetical protein
MATINYFGLTKKGTVTVNLTVTIDQLITAIATDEVLATEYYTVSAMNDFSKSSLTFGDSSTTLTQLGLVDGGTVLCTTNQTGSKQERQVSKLAIAGQKRSLTGRPSTLTIDNLPTKYTGNAVTDNANGYAGGVITNITIATPFSRNNGSGWNPAITTIGFDSGGGYTSTYGVPAPTNPTATPIFNGSNFLSGISIVTGGSGWIKHPGPGLQQGQVIIDIFIIQDNSTGDPDTREIKNTTNLGIDVTATDITPVGLVAGRPWSAALG